MIARVPDFFEPLTGYRGWNVDAHGFLTSANQGKRWKARKAVSARCTQSSQGQMHWHPETGATMPAPVAGCSCGYYAYKTEPQIDEYACTVRGSVKLWGTIIEHSEGYRAQFAYPFQLRCVNAKLAARLRHLYGVDCTVDESMNVKTAFDAQSYQAVFNQLTQQYLQSPALGLFNAPQLYPPISARLGTSYTITPRFDVLYGVGATAPQSVVFQGAWVNDVPPERSGVDTWSEWLKTGDWPR